MIVMMPDSQTLAMSYPSQWLTMCNYIATHSAELGIQFLLHVGDIVEHVGTATEWAAASDCFDELDNVGLPYLVCAGNHDYDDTNARDTTTYNAAGNFPTTRYTGQPWWDGAFYEVGHSENVYQLMTVGGEDYIFFALEFGPRQEVMDWVNATLAIHSTRKAIIATHSYLEADGTHTTIGDGVNPHAWYGAACNDGSDMWADLKVNDNVILILSGHQIGTPYMSSRSDNSDGGKAVAQIFMNWQEIVAHGYGGCRFITIDPVAKTMRIQTFAINGHWLDKTTLGEFTMSYG